MDEKIRAIAFYLPQFHTIPENDKWWGKGFTEWTNVKKAKPLFPGHYQPHVPSDKIGYYDLRDPKIRNLQAEMARSYGIYGFCYYYYWFGGKKLLETPLTEMLKSGKPDFPFCICWANENWTRRWDGLENEILIGQKHSDEDDLNFIKELIPFFKDKRYIRVNGKPLLIIYRTELFPNIERTATIWRDYIKKVGLGEIYLTRVESFQTKTDPKEINFDASIEFTPNWSELGRPINHNKSLKYKDLNREIVNLDHPIIYDYEIAYQNTLLKQTPKYKLFRGVFASWDNTPRRETKGTIFLNNDIQNFEYFIRRQTKYTYENFKGEERMLFINAWNEWAEGCHLEPDKKNGFKYLEICKKVCNEPEKELITQNIFEKHIEKLEFNMLSLKNDLNSNILENQIIRENNLKIEKLAHSIRIKNQKLNKSNQDLIRKNRQLNETKKLLYEREAELNYIKASKFWKMRDRYLRIKQFRPKHAAALTRKGLFILKKDGFVAFSRDVRDYILHGKGKLKVSSINNGLEITDYENWIYENEQLNKDQLTQKIKSLNYLPKISIIFPVFNANEIFLRKAIFSIIYQYYQNWELCIVDNNSTSKITKKILRDFQKRDPQRIKVIYLDKKEENSDIINKAADIAAGEFIGFSSHEDILSPNALYEYAKLLNKNPELDLIYSDEDKINEDLFRFSPNFKPDWSPELLLSYNYIGRFKIVRKKLFFELGEYCNRFGNFQDYDFLLRLSEKTDRIGHISKILFHNALLPGSTSDPKEPKYIEKGKQAVSETLERRKIKARAIIPDFAQKANLGIYKIGFSANDYNEKVTIIIPTKDRVNLLKKCIKSIKEKTNYKNYDILVIDNNSKERETFDYLINEKINYTSIPTKSFNFALINNFAVRKVKTELILFLNNDTEVISPDWLTEMVGTISLDKKIAAVGAKLVYDDKRVQHAGVIVGLSLSTASHANKMLNYNDPGYQYYNLVMRNYSAVTAACMLTRKSLFQEVGGFDEKNHAVFCNDVDYCLKLINSDYRVVYNPDALLYHHESKSRGFKDNIKEVEHFRKKWINIIKKDPFYNINLSLENERFEIKKY